jgi:hypothetical protein
MNDGMKIFVLLGAVCAMLVLGVMAAVAFLGFGLAPEKTPATSPVAVEAPRRVASDPMEKMERRVEALEKAAVEREARLRDLEAENKALRAEAARTAAAAAPRPAVENPAPAAAPEARAPEAATRGYRFGLKGATPVLDKADWKKLAVQFLDLRGGVGEVIQEFLKTGDLSMKTRLAMGEKNKPLAYFTIQASGEAPGMAENSTFTHPAVVASMVRALLENAGLPLSPVQDEAVRAAGESWARREEALNLQKLVDEVESRQRFLDDIRSFLSAGQQAALFDPATEGRAGVDLLSPALNLARRTPVTEPTREALEKTLVRESFKLLGIDRNPDDFAWLGAEWVESIPEAAVPVSAEGFRMDAAFPPLAKLLRCARAQIGAMKRLLERENFDEATRKGIRTLTVLAQPQVVLPAEKGAGEGK